MAKIVWSKIALNDLQGIYDFISKDSVFYANRYINLIIARIDILMDMPKAGRVVPEKGDVNLRELIEGNYRIFYTIKSENEVNIVRIHHASKNISGK